MENKIIKINRRYMRIVLRFLKETRLLPLWKEYVCKENKYHERYVAKHWSNTKYVDDVLGETIFTYFVKEKLGKRDGVFYYDGLPIFIRFAYWLQKLNIKGYEISPNAKMRLLNKSDEEMSQYIIIDQITKKAKLIFEK